MSDERAPLNETRIRYRLLHLAWRRLYYGFWRWWRKRNPARYSKHGDPPTEVIALEAATEITIAVGTFFALLIVAVFLRLLLRLVLRKGPPHWTQIRLGVYVERVPHPARRGRVGGADPDPAAGETSDQLGRLEG